MQPGFVVVGRVASNFTSLGDGYHQRGLVLKLAFRYSSDARRGDLFPIDCNNVSRLHMWLLEFSPNLSCFLCTELCDVVAIAAKILLRVRDVKIVPLDPLDLVGHLLL